MLHIAKLVDEVPVVVSECWTERTAPLVVAQLGVLYPEVAWCAVAVGDASVVSEMAS